MAKRATPEVNAGSMADIAFLLLIFFLVTTTMEVDTGLQRRLPQIVDEPPQEDTKVHKRNVYQIIVNKYDQILIGGEDISEVDGMRDRVVEFIDNNGDGTCTFCRGTANPAKSDNPTKAVVSLTNDRQTTYGLYLAIQNEVVAAYNILRERYAQEHFGVSWKELEREEVENPNDEKVVEKVKEVKNAYPLNISEAEPVDYSN